MCRTIKILILSWPQKLKFSQFLQAGKTCQLLLTFLTKVTRWLRSTSKFLCSDWSKFDRRVHAENLCSILKLVYFDSWSWQSFVSTCNVFNCLFPLNVQNEIQLLSRVACQSRKSDFGWHSFRFSPLEKMVHKQLMKHLEFNGFLSEHQFGFRPNRSTELAAVSYTHLTLPTKRIV